MVCDAWAGTMPLDVLFASTRWMISHRLGRDPPTPTLVVTPGCPCRNLLSEPSHCGALTITISPLHWQRWRRRSRMRLSGEALAGRNVAAAITSGRARASLADCNSSVTTRRTIASIAVGNRLANTGQEGDAAAVEQRDIHRRIDQSSAEEQHALRL